MRVVCEDGVCEGGVCEGGICDEEDVISPSFPQA